MRVSPEARSSYLELVADSVLPEGAILALFFRDAPERNHEPQPTAPAPAGPWRAVYAMEKGATGWTFLSMDGSGGLDPDLDGHTCQRCHDGAPADGVFGLPTAPPASTDTTAPPASTDTTAPRGSSPRP